MTAMPGLRLHSVLEDQSSPAPGTKSLPVTLANLHLLRGFFNGAPDIMAQLPPNGFANQSELDEWLKLHPPSKDSEEKQELHYGNTGVYGRPTGMWLSNNLRRFELAELMTPLVLSKIDRTTGRLSWEEGLKLFLNVPVKGEEYKRLNKERQPVVGGPLIGTLTLGDLVAWGLVDAPSTKQMQDRVQIIDRGAAKALRRLRFSNTVGFQQFDSLINDKKAGFCLGLRKTLAARGHATIFDAIHLENALCKTSRQEMDDFRVLHIFRNMPSFFAGGILEAFGLARVNLKPRNLSSYQVIFSSSTYLFIAVAKVALGGRSPFLALVTPFPTSTLVTFASLSVRESVTSDGMDVDEAASLVEPQGEGFDSDTPMRDAEDGLVVGRSPAVPSIRVSLGSHWKEKCLTGAKCPWYRRNEQPKDHKKRVHVEEAEVNFPNGKFTLRRNHDTGLFECPAGCGITSDLSRTIASAHKDAVHNCRGPPVAPPGVNFTGLDPRYQHAPLALRASPALEAGLPDLNTLSSYSNHQNSPIQSSLPAHRSPPSPVALQSASPSTRQAQSPPIASPSRSSSSRHNSPLRGALPSPSNSFLPRPRTVSLAGSDPAATREADDLLDSDEKSNDGARSDLESDSDSDFGLRSDVDRDEDDGEEDQEDEQFLDELEEDLMLAGDDDLFPAEWSLKPGGEDQEGLDSSQRSGLNVVLTYDDSDLTLGNRRFHLHATLDIVICFDCEQGVLPCALASHARTHGLMLGALPKNTLAKA
ncbi:hypothetical protein P7C70_g8733, partial [Phenoliferia sp. Uapishka_3]